MAFRRVYTLFTIVILFVCLTQKALALPRDGSVVVGEVKPFKDEFIMPKTEAEQTRTLPALTGNNVESGVTIHRVPCNFEETNEDVICQEHCLPKGYSYGICVNFTCSCI